MKGIGIETLEKYLQSPDPGRRQRAECWKMLAGMLRMDGLFISNALAYLIVRHIRLLSSTGDLGVALREHYANPVHKETFRWLRTDESDFAVQRAYAELRDPDFSLTRRTLRKIHANLYKGIYRCPESFRDADVSRPEWVLGGTHFAASCEGVSEKLGALLAAERAARPGLAGMTPEARIRHLAGFLAGIWKLQPFRQRNTFTLAVFALKYFAELGLPVDPSVFAGRAWYFRNALVRAAFDDPERGIRATTVPLERFLENLLLGGRNELKSADLRVPGGPGNALASAPADLAAAAELRIPSHLRRLVMVLDGEMSRVQMLAALELAPDRHFSGGYIFPAMDLGLVEIAYKPPVLRRGYRYRLGPMGLAWRYGTGNAWHRPPAKEKKDGQGV